MSKPANSFTGNSQVSSWGWDSSGQLLTIKHGGSTPAYVSPFFKADGTAAANTLHELMGTVTAATTSTAVTLVGDAAYTAAHSFKVDVIDQADGTVATLTAQTASSFTFTSVAAHVYQYFAKGY